MNKPIRAGFLYAMPVLPAANSRGRGWLICVTIQRHCELAVLCRPGRGQSA